MFVFTWHSTYSIENIPLYSLYSTWCSVDSNILQHVFITNDIRQSNGYLAFASTPNWVNWVTFIVLSKDCHKIFFVHNFI